MPINSESDAGRRAVDKLTERIVEHGKKQQQQGGKPISEETARRMAIDTARKTDREKGW